MKTLTDLFAQQRVFKGLAPAYLDHIATCASNVRFDQGEQVFGEGENADSFYLVRHGRIALELFVPRRGSVTIATINPGDVVGWSWLFPPYTWHYDARAIVLTRAVAFDANCLRGKCEEDNAFGYELMKRFARVMIDRLEAARFQLLDVYGHGIGS